MPLARVAGAAGTRRRLCRLSHALNDRTRGAVIALRAGGNRTGAESVMTSQTGYPMAVDFAGGAPRIGRTTARASPG